jgi:hypothetical protein
VTCPLAAAQPSAVDRVGDRLRPQGARGRFELLLRARRTTYVLDDHTVEEMIRAFTDTRGDVERYQDRWRREALSPAQRRALDHLSDQLYEPRGLVEAILALTGQLKGGRPSPGQARATSTSAWTSSLVVPRPSLVIPDAGPDETGMGEEHPAHVVRIVWGMGNPTLAAQPGGRSCQAVVDPEDLRRASGAWILLVVLVLAVAGGCGRNGCRRQHAAGR